MNTYARLSCYVATAVLKTMKLYSRAYSSIVGFIAAISYQLASRLTQLYSNICMLAVDAAMRVTIYYHLEKRN